MRHYLKGDLLSHFIGEKKGTMPALLGNSDRDASADD